MPSYEFSLFVQGIYCKKIKEIEEGYHIPGRIILIFL